MYVVVSFPVLAPTINKSDWYHHSTTLVKKAHTEVSTSTTTHHVWHLEAKIK